MATMASSRRRFLSLIGLSAVAVGCNTSAGSSSGGQAKTLRYQGWAGQVTLPELAEDLGYLEDVRLEWVGNTISGPQDIQSAATGQVDFGGAFNGAVVKLAASNAPIKAVISYYGSDEHTYNGFFVLENSPIREAPDLIGRTVGMNTLGGHSEALLDLHLRDSGVSRADIARVEPLVVPPVNTEQSLRQNQIDVAVLSGILREKAEEAGGIRLLFTDYDLLGAFSAGTYVMTDRFLAQNPETARIFVTAVGRAIEWSRTTPRDEVIARMKDIVGRRERNEDVEALDYWRSFGVAERAGLITGDELRLWVDWLSERGDIDRSQVTLSDLYTNEFNGNAPSPSATTSGS